MARRESSRVALVTGASGFVGSHLVESLVADGWEARCLMRPRSERRWLPPEARVVEASLEDGAALRHALSGVHTVFHLAAVTSAHTVEEYGRVNVEGTRRVIEAVSAYASGAVLLYCSSMAAAGPSVAEGAARESDPPRPIGPYGASKLAAERLIAAAGVRHVIVRPPTVYGPRDRDVLAMFRLVSYGVAPRIGQATQRLSMVHVDDLVEGLRRAAERGAAGAVYYVSGGVHSWREVVNALGRAVGRGVREIAVPRAAADVAALGSRLVARLRRTKPLLTPERVRDMMQPAWVCDDSEARSQLGYLPRVSLEAGVKSTAAWYREHGWL
ncbi:MAG TPA: NAD(P)-dependent oxidoreductase [Gemmatimonadaceae bacterium]|nr:NAD(P)-dependent oxidoreductase [Gemmatimonadaceae bacterium]